ncbi:MAG: NUDIX hydrolase [Polaromonas sp. 39-63-203]|jgi:8-oxo-dGTP pyrophosphatase MutT (NUDIX family)|uniref:NUDIX hydrolase n=1 Tax=Polaromonas sp. TaxID=1869339 RepID=UPI000BDD2AE6|nr:NUDIX hydrolase [Polaromonas sp.]OYY51470.1 MAG: NUDIX hydrolase [Polaromonas sp. 35-63-240]OYY94105.1 MAG: NUDIX hydrolase [Polaromonas sp. 28-63-22]OYZ82626.1 MAG: NUDIX hydrolase [Polaromonas sp. 24-62-144]OZA96182.1 MAG: NUDIX hydrolase [Polaromonas sp. 39-63-203]HQS33534.1 NUDIX hydrolase [Polaromonas sp.]
MNTRWKPSVTVAAVIAQSFDGVEKFLLVEEETRDGLRLNNPAGHLDPGESPEQGCARETLEETAFHFKPTALVGVYMSRFERVEADGVLDITYLRFAYCGELGAHVEGQALDEGIVRTVWLTADEIRASVDRHRSPLLIRCMEDYLAGRRFPLDIVTTDPSVLLHK